MKQTVKNQAKRAGIALAAAFAAFGTGTAQAAPPPPGGLSGRFSKTRKAPNASMPCGNAPWRWVGLWIGRLLSTATWDTRELPRQTGKDFKNWLPK